MHRCQFCMILGVVQFCANQAKNI